MRRRIAVVGDELTGGGQVLDYVQTFGFTFYGHKAALIGGEAYCTACRSTGSIIKTGGPYRMRYDTHEVALDRDIVLCKCPTPPSIIATLADESWCDDRQEEYEAASTSLEPSRVATGRYDEQFTLRDGNGHSTPGTYYTIELSNGDLIHGTTDSAGRTTRLTTEGAQIIRIYLGHRVFV